MISTGPGEGVGVLGERAKRWLGLLDVGTPGDGPLVGVPLDQSPVFEFRQVVVDEREVGPLLPSRGTRE